MALRALTYAQAALYFKEGRSKYKPIGVKFTKRIWLNYDSANDRYVLSHIKTKCYMKFVDELNKKTGKVEPTEKWFTAGASDRENYTMEAVAYVYQDHAHIFHPASMTGSNSTARDIFERFYNCIYRKAQGIKTKGFEWTFFTKDIAPHNRYHGNGDVFLSGSGMKVFFDERPPEPESQPLTRVHKKDEQKALNAHIKAVRRMLSLRAKLGGFNSIDWVVENTKLTKKYGTRSRWVIRDLKAVNAAFMAINDEDFLSMVPVLWMAAGLGTVNYWHEPAWGSIGASYDWLTDFNKLVDRVREGLRTENGAVEYVVNEPAQEGNEAAV